MEESRGREFTRNRGKQLKRATNRNWTGKGLCAGIQYLHDKLKILHNDIKSNNVVLDGCNISESEAVLVDFGKATYQICPKVYETPADTGKFRHLAPELGQTKGKQTTKSDTYSLGFMIRGLKYKHEPIHLFTYSLCFLCSDRLAHG